MAEGFITGRYNRGGGGGGNVNIFTGTLNEWNALSPAEKASYTHLFITDPVTTLAGYGITNAYTKDEVDALINGYSINVKTFTYTGDGTNPNVISFPTTPKFILGITNAAADSRGYFTTITPFAWGVSTSWVSWQQNHQTRGGTSVDLSYSNLALTIQSDDAGAVCNYNSATYTVFYLD